MTQRIQRFHWIDWAKVILIYLMVVGHCFPIKWQYNLIYAFHMPAFFFISGFLYKPHPWQKTLKAFGIPILLFSLVNLGVYILPKMIKGTLDFSHFMERCLLPYWGGVTNPDLEYIYLFPGVWFVITLLCARFLMGDIKCFSFVTKYSKVVLILLLVYLAVEPIWFAENPLIPYKLYRVVPSLPFLLTGYIMKDNIEAWIHLSSWKVLLLAGMFCTGTSLLGTCNILDYRFSYSYLLFYLNALIGSIVLFNLCTHFKANAVICTFSIGTLFVLAFNFNLRIICNVMLIKVFGSFILDDTVVLPWIIGAMIMGISYYPIKFLLLKFPLALGKNR